MQQQQLLSELTLGEVRVADHCGYCQGAAGPASVSFGLHALRLSALDYQALIDRGWRRSGSYLYRSELERTCCPLLTIRLDVRRARPGRGHRRLLARFMAYLRGEGPEPGAGRAATDDGDDEGDVVLSGSGPAAVLAAPVTAALPVDAAADLVSRSILEAVAACFGESAAAAVKSPAARRLAPAEVAKAALLLPHTAASAAAAGVFSAFCFCSAAAFQPPLRPHSFRVRLVTAGFDAEAHALYRRYQVAVHGDAEADCGAANYRRFLCEGPLAREPRGAPHFTTGAPSPSSSQQPLVEAAFLRACAAWAAGEGAGAGLPLTVAAGPGVQGEGAGAGAGAGAEAPFPGFGKGAEPYAFVFPDLTPSPHAPASAVGAGGDAAALPRGAADSGCDLRGGYGAFHMRYELDGRLVALGVVDVLPLCLSSVYLFYEPSLARMQLGKLSALYEIQWAQAARRLASPRLCFWYAGFYVQSCRKMRYKRGFAPSEVACPVTGRWAPLSAGACARLDGDKCARLLTAEEEEAEAAAVAEGARVVEAAAADAAARAAAADAARLASAQAAGAVARVALVLRQGPAAAVVTTVRALQASEARRRLMAQMQETVMRTGTDVAARSLFRV